MFGVSGIDSGSGGRVVVHVVGHRGCARVFLFGGPAFRHGEGFFVCWGLWLQAGGFVASEFRVYRVYRVFRF